MTKFKTRLLSQSALVVGKLLQRRLKVTWPKAARLGEFRAFHFSSASSEREHALWGGRAPAEHKKERDQPDRALCFEKSTITIELELIREKSRISRAALTSSIARFEKQRCIDCPGARVSSRPFLFHAACATLSRKNVCGIRDIGPGRLFFLSGSNLPA